jgi:hypothetical protein
VNVSQKDLNDLAATAFRIDGYLLRVQGALRRGTITVPAASDLETARQANLRIQHSLVRAGADDPREAADAETRVRMRDAGVDAPELKEIPIELLSSPAARRYAEAIRAAATACREMETERYGPDCDGFAEMLEDWARDAEFEVFGPVGLRGLE